MKSKFYSRLTMVFAIILMFTYIANAQTTLTIPILDDVDDGEEGENGRMVNGSSDLELGRWDDWTQDDTAQGSQTIGLKFNYIPIPATATIEEANITFTCDKGGASAVQMTIYGEMVGNPKSYTDKDDSLPDGTVDIRFDITSRPKTTASAVWDVPEWVAAGDAGAAQKTVDLSSIVQEIIGGPDWVIGNSIAFILVPTGPSAPGTIDQAADGREAEAGPGSDAATLNISYVEGISDNASLSSLTVDVGTLTPAFDAATYSYTAEVPEGTTSVTVSATAASANATITGDGAVDVSSGTGTATVVVTAEDGTTTLTYNVDITVSTSVLNITSERKFGLYPNPTKGKLNIKNTSADKFGYEIYSIIGKRVASRQDITGSRTEVDLSNFTKGVYFIVIRIGRSTETHKLILK